MDGGIATHNDAANPGVEKFGRLKAVLQTVADNCANREVRRNPPVNRVSVLMDALLEYHRHQNQDREPPLARQCPRGQF